MPARFIRQRDDYESAFLDFFNRRKFALPHSVFRADDYDRIPTMRFQEEPLSELGRRLAWALASLGLCAAMSLWFLSGRFPTQKPGHYVFASERYGVYGDKAEAHAYDSDPEKPIKSLKEAWERSKKVSGVVCRFHDLRHTAATRMLEGGSPLMVVASILGWSASTAARMAKRYGHIGNDAQAKAVSMLVVDRVVADSSARGHKRGHRDDAPSLSKHRKLLNFGSPHWTISATGSSVRRRKPALISAASSGFRPSSTERHAAFRYLCGGRAY